jgi:hypothetical protein
MERNCLNTKCGKPLSRRQEKYCSRGCQYAARRSPKADMIWELRLNNPKMPLSEMAERVDASYKYVSEALYINKHRPDNLLKRKYKPRQPKPKPAKKAKPEPLPEGRWGKHVAPGWLWRGGEALEEKYGHLGQRKRKRKK